MVIRVKQKNKKTMKKTYITPSMETVKIAARNQMLTESLSLGFGGGTKGGGDACGRGSDDWDED